MKETYTRKIDDLMPMEINFHLFGEGSPKVFFTGGIHGGEATGIYVVEKVRAFLEANELLKGSVKVLPIANPAAFRRMQRTSPYDELDLNRIFPGQEDSAPSLALAKLLWQEAQDADYIVDLHCCGVWGASYTLSTYGDHDHAKDLSAMLDIPIVIESGGSRGQLFVEASDVGIPAVIIELPGGGPGGVIDLEAAEKCYQALLNMLRQLGMIAGEAVPAQATFYGKLRPVFTKEAGLFLPAIETGATFQEGDVLGHVGATPILAPLTGVATMVRPASYVFKGTPLANIAPLAE